MRTYIEGVNWMHEGNLTLTILNDTLNRIANVTGATWLETETTFWRVLAGLERRWGVELYLGGQVFAEDDAPLCELASKEFWEDFVQDAIRLTREELEK